MKKHHILPAIGALGLLLILMSLSVRKADAQGGTPTARPTVFQAAGTTVSSILCAVDHFRAALGQPNNANTPGPLASGRREINWDGGGSTETALAATPFTGFMQGRGALFTTPGTGFAQAPLSGLAETFANPTYTTIFQPFSPLRLFTPMGSNITDVDFFVPGAGDVAAATTGFGVVFSDVDKPDGTDPSAQTLIQDYGLFEEYEPPTARWLIRPAIPTPRTDVAIATANGRLFVIGGWLPGGLTAKVESYDPGSNSWAPAADLPSPLSFAGAALVKGRVFLAGGARYLKDGSLAPIALMQVFEP